MRNFRLLRPDEIECRVQQVKQDGVILLLYKTARTDAALLDETVGSMNWCNDYKVIDGKMYCGIGIRDKESGAWVWKWNCGTESNMEKEKGEASDALKRAGFTWGIGAELYSSPFIYVPASKCRISNGKCFDAFEVSSIGYDKAENINALVISVNGQPVWNMGSAKKAEAKPKQNLGDVIEKARENNILKEEPIVPLTGEKKYVCSQCGAEITERVAKYSYDKFGKPLCYRCQK